MCQDCAVLYEKMKSQEHELYQVKNALRNSRAETKYERRRYDKLLKETRKEHPKNHYRNGQKRGAYGRNG